MLSDKAVTKYQLAVLKAQGRNITHEKARKEAEHMIRLYEAVFKPYRPNERSKYSKLR